MTSFKHFCFLLMPTCWQVVINCGNVNYYFLHVHDQDDTEMTVVRDSSGTTSKTTVKLVNCEITYTFTYTV